ncbi:MAG: sialidase family protein [Nitrosomonadaceae bacterium]|nr:sialidase family protein [Nitrosomonadaceae bacterium]
MPDYPITESTVRINRKTIARGFLGCLSLGSSRLLNYLLLLGAMAFSTASYGYHPKAGTTDYTHYPQGGGLFVTAAFGPDDRLWRVVPEKWHVYVDYSTDLGKTFSAPVRINKKSQRIKVSGENRPGIAVDRSGRISVIYPAEGTQPIALYFSTSTDNGRSFSIPKPLSDKASEANFFQGRLVLNASGQAHIFWLDERDRTDWRQPGNAIYYTTVDGQGSPDFINQKLSDTLCECCRIAAAIDNDGQPVLFARFIYPGGIRDHGLLRTRADGREPLSWRVTFDQWEIKGCPEHGPALSISTDGRYHIAWFTQGSVRQGLFYAYSSDRGQNFSYPLPFGTPEKLPSHPDIMARGKHVILTWTEYDGAKTQLLMMQSTDGGQTWLPARSIAESTNRSDFPFLLSNARGIFVSWNSKSEGYRLIPLD